MIHRPKLVLSNVPEGLIHNTLITTNISDSCRIISEFWNDSPKPLWKIGSVVIARKGYAWKTIWELGKHSVFTTIYDAQGRLVGSYWKIGSRVQKLGDSFAYEDWYLDIWQASGAKLVLLDEFELKEAVAKNYISLADADTAKWVAFRVLELNNVD
jgi:predicted RNA-binding protein associated with RNAse of E/G family